MSLEAAGRQAQCPNCGGPIEWKLGASAAQICRWCQFSVVRTDRDLRAIGRVADLVPTAAAMTVGDDGRIGGVGFTVAGRLQLDHGKGPWDEWYVGFDDGRWGWLANAQGHWYATMPVATARLPACDQMRPGESGVLPGGGDVPWTVSERGRSQVVSAEGELPYPITSGERGQYVDLAAPGDGFATIDYGDGTEAPRFYIGRRYSGADVVITAGAMGPRPEQRIDVKALKCPSCGGPCPILVPEQTERAACPSCHALLDFHHGALQYLSQLNQPQITPWIPLGTEGTLGGEPVMCIGFMERGVVVEGTTYTWREYLLHSAGGYRWLLEDSNHWTLVRPVSAADVKVQSTAATYGGRKHKLFSMAEARVRFVIGEFYWKVEVGEQTDAADFIAPPYILSEERSDGEVNWSAGQYIAGADVWTGFKLSGSPPRPFDVAPAQPNPVGLKFPLVLAVIGALALAGVFLLTKKDIPQTVLVDGPVAIPSAPEAAMATRGNTTAGSAAARTQGAFMAASGPSINVSYTPPFTLPPKVDTVRVAMTSDLGHGWLGVACALISESDGKMTEFALEQDQFQHPGPERLAAGRTTEATIGGLEPGTSYVLRLDPRWARKPGSVGETTPPAANLRISSYDSSDSTGCCCLAVMLILLPLPLELLRRHFFERRRWRNSNVR